MICELSGSHFNSFLIGWRYWFKVIGECVVPRIWSHGGNLKFVFMPQSKFLWSFDFYMVKFGQLRLECLLLCDVNPLCKELFRMFLGASIHLMKKRISFFSYSDISLLLESRQIIVTHSKRWFLWLDSKCSA